MKKMCYRPKRRIVKFFDHESDMSLYTFLRDISATINDNCKEEGCGKAEVFHTHYMYHGNGCIKFKAYKGASEMTASQKYAQMFEIPTFIHCFCVECNRIILANERIPNELLEISFYKLLENIFYNQSLSVSTRRDQDAMPGEQRCTHSLFRDCELVFRFG